MSVSKGFGIRIAKTIDYLATAAAPSRRTLFRSPLSCNLEGGFTRRFGHVEDRALVH